MDVTDIQQELEVTLDGIRKREVTIPLLSSRHAVGEVGFRAMPAGMLELVASSPDFVEIVPGDDPTWLMIMVDEVVAEMVVYRALADDQHYVLGPIAPTVQ